MSNQINNIYQLNFQGGFALQGEKDLLFHSPVAKQSGIYLFTVEYKDGFLIQYAGLTGRPFKERFQEHIREYRNGVYTILDPNGFQQGERIIVWRGFWSKFKKRNLEINKELKDEFESHFQQIEYATEKLLAAYRIFLAPLDAQRRVLARIEASIMNILYSGEGVVSTFPDRGMSLAPRWNNEELFSVHSSSKARLCGLPNLFEA